MPDVVVGALLRHARHHRERRLRPGQRLDLGLLVHAQHDRGLGRVQVQPDDVVDLVHEQRVVGQLEPVRPCGLSSNARQIRPMSTSTARSLGHLRPRPVGGVLRGRFQRRDHDVLDLFGGDRRAAAPAAAHRPDRPAATRRTGPATCPPSAAHTRSAQRPPCCPSPSAQPTRSATATPTPAPTSRRRPTASCSRSSAVNSNTAFGRPVRRHTTILLLITANFRRTTLGDR